MGKIKQGILGGFSGSVAGVVGSSWKGIAVIKAKPLSVANPKTAAQVANRTAFKAATLDASLGLVQIVKPLWDRDAQLMSGYNAFVSANKQAYSDAGVLDVTKYVQTLGKLDTMPVDDFVIASGQPNVEVSWDGASMVGDQLATDDAFIAVYNETQDNWGFSTGAKTRVDDLEVIVMPSNLEVGDALSGWLCFQGVSAAKKKFKASSDLSNTVQ